ncbi:MAG: hypothetical protein LBQ24_07435 [Candidatus Peribacteria bacterium]|jgi:hypothetical protein|nr:hypothetical protein [Candidatus Peribacteria bacterium]
MLSKLQTNILKINKNSLKNENTLNFLNYLEAIINQQIVTTTTAKTLTAETTTTPNGIDTSTL